MIHSICQLESGKTLCSSTCEDAFQHHRPALFFSSLPRLFCFFVSLSSKNRKNFKTFFLPSCFRDTYRELRRRNVCQNSCGEFEQSSCARKKEEEQGIEIVSKARLMEWKIHRGEQFQLFFFLADFFLVKNYTRKRLRRAMASFYLANTLWIVFGSSLHSSCALT